MKAACRFCHEINEFDDPKPAKEPCKCGLTDDVRMARVAGMVAILLSILASAGCWLEGHYTVEQMKLLPDAYKVEIRKGGFGDGQPHVVPKEK